jgi:N,N'-diacetyllegionaminate synthase
MTINKLLSTNNSPLVIAEVGVNHEGSYEKACELIKLAQAAGADFVKFQSYTPIRYASCEDQQRLKRVSRFALSNEDFLGLSQLATKLGIGFLSTPLTEDWVEVLNPFCAAFKIASGDITFKPVIKNAAHTGKPLIISTGAATIDEIDQAVSWVCEEVGQENLKDRLILMHCVAAYPTPIEEANVMSIPFLRDRYGISIGYSNHVMGMEASLAAVALGASVIEIHFTDQKEGREFRDHALSFESEDLRKFIEMSRLIKASLGVYDKVVQSCEKDMIPMIRKGVIAARSLKAGVTLTEEDLIYARPATEFKALEIDQLIGKVLTQDIETGYLIPKDAIKCVA